MEIIKNKNFSIFCLLIFCLCIFFAFLGSYPLIDVDETRYVRIAQEMFNSHNFLTPVINGELFLEKPPLFFWLEDLSFYVFRHVNEWSARIPMGFIATLGVFSTFFIGKKLVSERFGLISAVVLGSNIIYIILSHIAILDLLLSVTMMISAYCGILTLFYKGKLNWLLWFGFYFFCGLSILSKGIPGFVIPFAVTFFTYVFTKNLKELFDFRKIGLGFLLLLLIVLPWHIMMCKVHGQAFIDEYIIKHHIARFVNSNGINRKEPCWFFIPVILVGFIPFIFPLLSVLISKIVKWFKTFKSGFKYNIFNYFSPDNEVKKLFLNINIMSAILIFLFFSSSSTKLATYILPIVFPLSFIIGYIFDENFNNKKYDFEIKVSDIILTLIFLFASIVALVCIFLKIDILLELRPILISGFILFLTYSIFNLNFLNNDKKYFFSSTVIFMVLLTFILNLQIFNFVVSFGEKDLIDFAKTAKQEQKKLATFDFGERYATIFYYGNHVDIKQNNDKYLVIMKKNNFQPVSNFIDFETKLDTEDTVTINEEDLNKIFDDLAFYDLSQRIFKNYKKDFENEEVLVKKALPEYEWFNDKLNNNYYVILKNENILEMPDEVKSKFKVIKTGKKYSLVEKNEI